MHIPIRLRILDSCTADTYTIGVPLGPAPSKPTSALGSAPSEPEAAATCPCQDRPREVDVACSTEGVTRHCGVYLQTVSLSAAPII